MGGIAGISGPVPTLWTTLRGWDKDLQRGVLQAFNIAMHVATMTGYILSGSIGADTLVLFAWIAPALAVPAVLGVLVFRRLSVTAFRRLILGFLILSGIALVGGSAGQVFSDRRLALEHSQIFQKRYDADDDDDQLCDLSHPTVDRQPLNQPEHEYDNQECDENADECG